jgi:hypothetical protein
MMNNERCAKERSKAKSCSRQLWPLGLSFRGSPQLRVVAVYDEADAACKQAKALERWGGQTA